MKTVSVRNFRSWREEMSRNPLLFCDAKLVLVLLLLLVLSSSNLSLAFAEHATPSQEQQQADPKKSSAELNEIKRLEEEADKLIKERKYDVAIEVLVRAL